MLSSAYLSIYLTCESTSPTGSFVAIAAAANG